MKDLATGRDLRLDFWRGLAMFIIFIAHVRGNKWGLYIPAKFGPSDATEMFVFCSGFASAIAFGGAFQRHGFGIGAARILFRCFQIYWAHIGLFIVVATLTVVGMRLNPEVDYIGRLNLYPFFNDPQSGLIGLLTFTYVPNYFDILPMYVGVLLMMPIVMLLSRIGLWAPALFILTLYLANFAFDLGQPAEWWSERHWFFDPYGWALIFYTGFAFGIGWLKPPPVRPLLVLLALAFVLFMVPMKWHPIWSQGGVIGEMSRSLLWGFQKTDFGVLRYVHFLALAYLMHALILKLPWLLQGAWAKPIVKVGQQALPTFLSSMVLSWIGGMMLDIWGRHAVAWTAVNLSGFAALIAIAYLSAFFKQQPWKRKREPAASGTAGALPERATAGRQ